MYKVDENKIFNNDSCIFESLGKIEGYLIKDGDIIFCYDLQDFPIEEYMKLPFFEQIATVLRINPQGKTVWRIEAPDKGEFTYIYIDKNGKYRAATSGYEIYYFDPETGKTQGWDYE